MALITCNECGREISNTAVSCPHCGFQINKSEGVKKADAIGWIILIGLGILVLLSFLKP